MANAPTKAEITRKCEEGFAVAQQHFARVICCEKKGDDPAKPVSAASGVNVSWQGKSCVLTCHHVIKADPFVPVRNLASNTPRQSPDFKQFQKAATVSCSDKTIDLALLHDPDRSDLPNGAIYDLSWSEGVTRELLARNLGALTAFCGAWNEPSDVTPLGADQIFGSTVLYAACGPLVEVSDDLLFADFREETVFRENRQDFPDQLAGKSFGRGKARSLDGVSGTGLWIRFGGRWVLAGILLGPKGEIGDP